jgi:hypothetical protein
VDQPRQLERLLTTLGCFAQGQRQLGLQVIASLDLRPAPTPAEPAEAAAEEVGEL